MELATSLSLNPLERESKKKTSFFCVTPFFAVGFHYYLYSLPMTNRARSESGTVAEIPSYGIRCESRVGLERERERD